MLGLSALMGERKHIVVNVVVVLYVDTVDGSQDARTAEAMLYVSTDEKSINARTAEALLYANTDDGRQYARSVVVAVYVYMGYSKKRCPD